MPSSVPRTFVAKHPLALSSEGPRSRKHAALQTAAKKQRHSENSLWPWVVKNSLLNGDKLGLGIDREWSRDGCEAIGSGGWPWVAAESPERDRISQKGKLARRSCSGGRWRPEIGGLGRQGTGDEVVKKWWPEVERRRRIGAKSVQPLESFSGQTAGRMGVEIGGVVRRREGKVFVGAVCRTVTGGGESGLRKHSAVREREERERPGGSTRGRGKKEKKEKKRKEKEKKGKRKKEKEKRKRKKKRKRKRDVGKR
ncbi:hypothetical protein CIPAW_10G135000 [Carya illinoinensis]|uniref:Uncharacterized protein n=1 Tax=Carya illinoinensis TaxID=32201 RepID=A0A8T1PFL4_CARIL|nr:hypothetical protein CIPAW_10G135000 [Carya illinoinensis]